MSQEILDKIRYRINNPNTDYPSTTEGVKREQKALRWVLKLFKDQEKFLKRRVIIEKFKKKTPRRKPVRRRAMEFNLPEEIIRPTLLRLGLGGFGRMGGWGNELL
jgi:hypothetical protein